MRSITAILMTCVSIGLTISLTACKSGGGNQNGNAATPQADPFVAFVQQLAQSQPDDAEPEDVSGIVVSSSDNAEPLAL